MSNPDPYEIPEEWDPQEIDSWVDVDVMFVLRGDNLDPEAITERLGIAPTRCQKKGEHRFMTRSGRWRTNPSSTWHYESTAGVKSEDVIEHVRYLLSALEPKIDLIRQLRAQADYSAIWISYKVHKDNVASFGIPSDLLTRLAALVQDVNISVVMLDE